MATASGTQSLNGHQEYALQGMTDFFGRRPLVQMRNAFRDADVDRSGELDIGEFRQAVKSLNIGLKDNDIDTVFHLADTDGSGTLGIDEFFINFRHDHWPRERFFWSKQAGGAANLTKKERVEVASKLELQFEQPVSVSTPEIMKVLTEKVAMHGSAEKVFRVIDTNNNGLVDLDEIPAAIKPYQLHVSHEQAAEVLQEINRIAGNPPLKGIDYHTFALAFNPTGPPEKMGSIAFQEPRDSELVKRREPVESSYPVLGPERSLETLSLSKSQETIEHMRSLSTLPATRPLDHSASIATFRSVNNAQDEGKRYDMMAGWRGDGDDAIDGGGDRLGKDLMHVGRTVDWHAHNKQPSKFNMYRTKSEPVLTPLEGGLGTVPTRSSSKVDLHTASSPSRQGTPGATPVTNSAAPLTADAKADASSAAPPARRPPTPSYMQQTQSSHSLHSLTPSTTNSSQRTLRSTRSRLSLALESAGSRSSFECLYPGATSHHHVQEPDRLAYTSSIASLNSVSSAVLERENALQRADKNRREARLQKIGLRQAERSRSLQNIIAHDEEKLADVEQQRKRNYTSYAQRIGQHQLLELTRGMENGKKPVLLEPSPLLSWVPVPPHLSSNWKTISGQLQDPPPRETTTHLNATIGRRPFPDRRLSDPHTRPTKPVWGGAEQPVAQKPV